MGVLNQFHFSLTLNETAIEVNIFSIRSAISSNCQTKKKSLKFAIPIRRSSFRRFRNTLNFSHFVNRWHKYKISKSERSKNQKI